jgi:myo-inositol-1-phosphate synthase
MLTNNFKVQSPNVKYEDNHIISEYNYKTTEARINNNEVTIIPKDTKFVFKTNTKVPRMG